MRSSIFAAIIAIPTACLGCSVQGPAGDGDGETTSGNGATGAGNGSGNGAGPSSGPGAGPGSGSSGAGAAPPDCPEGAELCLPKPASGFQIESVGEVIQPGQDVEYCEVVVLPGDPGQTYYVNKFEVAMTDFSHHLIVSAAKPGSATEQDMAPGEKVTCIGGDVFGNDLIPVTGSQHKYEIDEFPPGVGRVYHGGQKLVFDYHYFNSSQGPVQARAAVNFHTVDASQIQHIAQAFGMYNLSIWISPGQQADFTKSCNFTTDAMVFQLTRHTHKWGTNFDVWFAGGPQSGQHIYTSPNYEDTTFAFPEPVLMKAGTGFKFRCSFNNTSSHTLTFGTKADDEMCILFGAWYQPSGNQESEQGCFGF
jgi:hypothetical protein